jgi:membrane-bound metal-dependent hydrolase YbcI (DUF457 family)
VVWAADLIDRRPSSARLALAAAALATTPDLDLLVAHFHRSATHSVTAVLLVWIITAAVTGQVSHLRGLRYGGQPHLRAGHSGRQAGWRVAAILASAYATHLLTDWLAADYFPPAGIQAFWPFSRRFFISGWDVFDQTERLHLLAPATIDQNTRAIAKELALLGPIALGLWLIRIKTLSRFSSQLARGHHPPQ